MRRFSIVTGSEVSVDRRDLQHAGGHVFHISDPCIDPSASRVAAVWCEEQMLDAGRGVLVDERRELDGGRRLTDRHAHVSTLGPLREH